MAFTHSVFPGGIPEGPFDEDNLQHISATITSILRGEFNQSIVVDRESIVRVMQRVLKERIETVPKMNQRVVMYCCNDFRNHQQDLLKKLKWEEYYVQSQQLFDPSVGRGPDMQKIKIANRLGNPRIGGTSRFYFT